MNDGSAIPLRLYRSDRRRGPTEELSNGDQQRYYRHESSDTRYPELTHSGASFAWLSTLVGLRGYRTVRTQVGELNSVITEDPVSHVRFLTGDLVRQIEFVPVTLEAGDPGSS